MLNNLTVIDVETPSLLHDRICSIGIVRIEGGAVVSKESCLVNPECDFSPRNISVHGIHPEDVWDSPTFQELWERLEPFFYDGAVVAHNARFDLTVLAKTLRHYGLALRPLPYIDTCELAYSFYPRAANCRLSTLCNQLGIPLEHHKAGSDAEATAKLLLDMIRRGLVIDQLPLFEYVPSEQRQVPLHNSSSATTDGIRTLRRILHQITADGIIDDYECQLLYAWMKDHRELSGNYPFDDIYVLLELILEDGTADSDELAALRDLAEQALDPVSVACDTSKPDIQGMNIVLTGEFQRGEKAVVGAELTAQGAVIQRDVTRKTGLLLVGSLGNDLWVAKNYGTKVKRALELQTQGFPIRIMKEEDFFSNEEDEMEQEILDASISEKTNLISEWAAQLRSELKPRLMVLGDIAKRISVEETKQYVSLKAGSILVASFRPVKAEVKVEFKSKYDVLFPNECLDHRKERLSCFTLNTFGKVHKFADTFCEMAVKELSGAGFGCCSRYEECSDARKCIQPMKLLSLACQYRKNLEQGRIFYGKNKNIPE